MNGFISKYRWIIVIIAGGLVIALIVNSRQVPDPVIVAEEPIVVVEEPVVVAEEPVAVVEAEPVAEETAPEEVVEEPVAEPVVAPESELQVEEVVEIAGELEHTARVLCIRLEADSLRSRWCLRGTGRQLGLDRAAGSSRRESAPSTQSICLYGWQYDGRRRSWLRSDSRRRGKERCCLGTQQRRQFRTSRRTDSLDRRRCDSVCRA